MFRVYGLGFTERGRKRDSEETEGQKELHTQGPFLLVYFVAALL